MQNKGVGQALESKGSRGSERVLTAALGDVERVYRGYLFPKCQGAADLEVGPQGPGPGGGTTKPHPVTSRCRWVGLQWGWPFPPLGSLWQPRVFPFSESRGSWKSRKRRRAGAGRGLVARGRCPSDPPPTLSNSKAGD